VRERQQRGCRLSSNEPTRNALPIGQQHYSKVKIHRIRKVDLTKHQAHRSDPLFESQASKPSVRNLQVGRTVTTVPAHGGRVADQHDTAVLPHHRRRGLARWIKADQSIRLHADFPTVRAVTVTVNQANLPMLAVNRALGYHPIRRRLLVEVPVAGRIEPSS
jgi:hypothetical protein